MPKVENIDEITSLKIVMDGKFSQLHSEIREDEQFYDLNVADLLNLPRKFRKDGIVLPTAREVIDTAADHIAPVNRRVNVPRRKTDKSGTAQANKIRRFYEALLNWLDRKGDTSRFRNGGKGLGLTGITVWKLIYDKKLFPPKPTKVKSESDEEFKDRLDEWKVDRKNVIPFDLQVLHPGEVIFDHTHEPPQWIIQTSNKMVGDIKDEFPSWPNPKNRKNTDEVEVLEYWEDKRRAVIIDKTSALKGEDEIIKHRQSVHPYIIGGSGLGHDDWEHRLEKKYVGLLRFIKAVLLAESRAYSIADIVLKGGAWPVRVAEGDRANEMPRIRLEYGTVQPLPPGVKITDLTPQLPAEMVFNFMSLNNGIISAAAAPRVVRGLREPGITSGFDRQLELGQARLRYGPLVWTMERMLEETCRKVGRIMQALDLGPINIQAGTTEDNFMSISGTDFKNHHAVEIKVGVLEPEDEIRKHNDAIALVAGGLMSPQTAIRTYFPNVDPSSEMGRILAARLMFSEPVMNLIGEATLGRVSEKLGLEEVLERIFARAEEVVNGGSGNGRRAASEPDVDGAPVKGSPADQAALREQDGRETGGTL